MIPNTIPTLLFVPLIHGFGGNINTFTGGGTMKDYLIYNPAHLFTEIELYWLIAFHINDLGLFLYPAKFILQ